MQIFKLVIVLVSFFAIVGTAVFQLFVLVASAAFAQQSISQRRTNLNAN